MLKEQKKTHLFQRKNKCAFNEVFLPFFCSFSCNMNVYGKQKVKRNRYFLCEFIYEFMYTFIGRLQSSSNGNEWRKEIKRERSFMFMEKQRIKENGKKCRKMVKIPFSFVLKIISFFRIFFFNGWNTRMCYLLDYFFFFSFVYSELVAQRACVWIIPIGERRGYREKKKKKKTN